MKAYDTMVSTNHETVSMEKFFPALVQCFGIIMCGYTAGRLKIISDSETKGLNTFVGTFALPSLIFISLVELNWDAVNWAFMSAMLISKLIVFSAVLLITLLTTRPLSYGRAGLFSIFCTQSNDFAIGYPIVLALYKDSHPEYASYLYLMGPISLAILNPIGLIFMEISKVMKNKAEMERQDLQISEGRPAGRILQEHDRRLKGKYIILLNTLTSLIFNPLLLMTLLGVGFDFIFQDGLPEIISGVMRVFGSSFSATALFLLGLKIVGQGNALRGSGFLLPSILIIVKILVFPLVCRQTVNIMQTGANFNDTTELSSFGFFYGTFPAAPTAFVIASQYGIEPDLIAQSMVLCTFISAPFMFISAKMISLTNLNPPDFLHELDVFSFDISAAGIVASIWILLIFIATNRYKRIPHKITTCLVLSQLMCCTSVIIWFKFGHSNKWTLHAQFVLFILGSYGTCFWTALLAITLVFLQCRGLCFVLNLWPYMLAFAWGIPAIVSILLLIFDDNVKSDEKHNPSFQYGNAQAAISVFILVMCFIVTVGCLVLHQRYKARNYRYIAYSQDIFTPESENLSNMRETLSTANLLNSPGGPYNISRTSDEEETLGSMNCIIISRECGGSICCDNLAIQTDRKNMVDIEDLSNIQSVVEPIKEKHYPIYSSETKVRSAFDCNIISSSIDCQIGFQRYEEQMRQGLEPLESSDNDLSQTLRHTVILIILLCSMLVAVAVSIWTLVMEGMSGIYLELSFLDSFLKFGQSLIVLAVFLPDSGELVSRFIRIWRQLWYGANIVSLPHWSNLNSETKHICEQFRSHHLDNCKKDIAKDRRWRIKIYRQVFFGSDLVNWLIDIGLSKDRLEAVLYAKHLVDGRVLCHINNVYHFEDKQLLYQFMCEN